MLFRLCLGADLVEWGSPMNCGWLCPWPVDTACIQGSLCVCCIWCLQGYGLWCTRRKHFSIIRQLSYPFDFVPQDLDQRYYSQYTGHVEYCYHAWKGGFKHLDYHSQDHHHYKEPDTAFHNLALFVHKCSLLADLFNVDILVISFD